MRRSAVLRCLSAAFALAACAKGAGVEKSGEPDGALTCAALISAASQMAGEGRLKADPEFSRQALGSSMMHLNAYAIPAGLEEPEAFRQVKALRDDLMETTSPADILNRAKACILTTPGR